MKKAAVTWNFPLVPPQVAPLLDAAFRPAVLAHHAFLTEVGDHGEPLVIGLERNNRQFSRFETRVLPQSHPHAGANLKYVERLVKFLVWQRGGHKLYVGGPRNIGAYIQDCYSLHGKRAFDYRFMGEDVYEQAFTVVPCSPDDVPPAREGGEVLGRNLEGCRIGFDLGASDRKTSAVVNGRVIFSEEVTWDPRKYEDPERHYQEIIASLRIAASRMSRVDGIGGCSAGIYIDNRPMVASLFRGVPKSRFGEVRTIFIRMQKEMGVPIIVMNDGDITALAGSMSLEQNGVLGIAMGSSEAAGYVDLDGKLLGWLSELAFAPIDYSPDAPADEWSGDTGCGSQYLSQNCVFRLASRAGIQLPTGTFDAEKLKSAQEGLEAGDEGALRIWQTMGVYFGYALAHYADFYQIGNVLILGRCTSGKGGRLILDNAKEVLRVEFPQLLDRVHIQLPDERSRRIGQSIAAASLPVMVAVR